MANPNYKQVGAFWKGELGGRKVLMGEVDLDLRGLEVSNKNSAKVRVTLWPNVDKKDPKGPDYSMSAKVSGLAPAKDEGRMGPKPTSGYFDEEDAGPQDEDRIPF